MALRNIRIDEDPVLRKKARVVEKIDEKIIELLDDMAETMYNAEGVGLAAPQIGILKRVVTIDVEDENGLLKMINPEILETSGEQCGLEGCLSIPEVREYVKRPEKVKFKYIDVEGNENIIDATGLLAVCICHEIDHLNGILFTDISISDEEAGAILGIIEE